MFSTLLPLVIIVKFTVDLASALTNFKIRKRFPHMDTRNSSHINNGISASAMKVGTVARFSLRGWYVYICDDCL